MKEILRQEIYEIILESKDCKNHLIIAWPEMLNWNSIIRENYFRSSYPVHGYRSFIQQPSGTSGKVPLVRTVRLLNQKQFTRPYRGSNGFIIIVYWLMWEENRVIFVHFEVISIENLFRKFILLSPWSLMKVKLN